LVADDPKEAHLVATARARFGEWCALTQPYVAGALGDGALSKTELLQQMLARKALMDEVRTAPDSVLADQAGLRSMRDAAASRATTIAGVSAIVVLILVATTLLLVTRRNLLEVAARFQGIADSERTAREDAEDALRVRENFLHMASHELKTPVTS